MLRASDADLGVTTSDMAPEDVELEADYEISLRTGSYQIVSGYRYVELHNAHRLPECKQVKRIGAQA